MACARYLIGPALFVVFGASVWSFYASVFVERETIPPDQKWEFQFGRGSGWHGLDVVRITSDGKSEFEYQVGDGKWERKEFIVPQKQIAEMREAIDELNILQLHKSNVNPNIFDGTQWVLLIRTEGKSQSFYFDNRFPPPIRELAEFVDRTIMEPFAKPAAPAMIQEWHQLKHEKELWESIR